MLHGTKPNLDSQYSGSGYTANPSFAAEPDQAVCFIEPKNNATVDQEFTIKMGIRGMASNMLKT